MRKPSLQWTAAAVVLAALVALPVAASQEAGTQELSAQEEEILARVKAEVEAAMAEMKENLARMKEELAALQEGEYLRDFDVKLEGLKLDEEAMAMQMERAHREAQRAAEMAKIESELAARRLPEIYFAGAAPRIWSWHSAEFGSFVLDLADKLELTDVQRDQIRDLQREHKRQTIERRAEIEVAEMDLETLESADTPDLAAMRAQLEELAGLKIDEQIAGMQLEQEIRQVLTQEQRDQLDDIDAKFGPRRVRIKTSRR
jgi:Spy/CpxP family protein refolding chaperone